MTILKNLKENRGQVTLASVLITSLMLMSAGLYVFANQADAAAITAAKDVLSTSSPGAAANHTFTFTINNAIDASDTLSIDVADGTFTFGTTGFAITDAKDYDIDDDGVDKVVVVDAACAANQFEIDSITSSTFTFTYCAGSTSIATGSIMTVQIGTNAATSGGTGDTQMTNPAKVATVGTADTPTITIGGTFAGTGDVLVAIIEGVAVSVTVDESLSFSIVGVANATCDTEFTTLTGPDTVTTDAAVPFGTLATETFSHACHDLTISTNAAGGYTITGEENTSLLRTGAGDTTIDDTIGDGGTATESTAAAWSTATNNGFGYSCEDSGGSQGDCAISASTNYKQFACLGSDAQCDVSTGAETIQTIASNAGPVSSKVSTIEYKLSIDGVQPAGTYSNIVTYIATPTF